VRDVKQRIKNVLGKKLLVAPFKMRGVYCVCSKGKTYKKLLEEFQMKLLYYDVSECESQELIIVVHSDIDKRLLEDTKEMIKVMRYKVIEL